MKHKFGLKARFISLIIVLLTTIFASVAGVLIQSNGSSLKQQLLERSKAFAALATKPIGDTYLTYKDSGTIIITSQVESFTKLDNTIMNVAVVDLGGHVKYTLKKGTQDIPAGQASSFEPQYIYNHDGAIERIVFPFIQDNGSHSYALIYDISNKNIEQTVRSIEMSIIEYSLGGLIISAIVMYLLISRLFLIPIRKLRDQALVISSGYYSEKISVDREDEIGDLSQSVEQMASTLMKDIDKLKEVDKLKSEFMMIASHNLRTPLTIIDGNLEMAKNEQLSEQMRKIMTNVEMNSRRLKIFAEDLLIISSVEAGQKIFSMENVGIDGLLQQIATEFTPSAEVRHVHFTAHLLPTNSIVQGSSVHLRNAIYNLLDNALKFTKDDGTIELSVTHSGDNIQISITDNGAGIAPDEIGKLFTKFHRGTSTLEYNYDGSGIGLYLTKLIITEHHGNIDVMSELGKGSTFTITLPVSSELSRQAADKPLQ